MSFGNRPEHYYQKDPTSEPPYPRQLDLEGLDPQQQQLMEQVRQAFKQLMMSKNMGANWKDIYQNTLILLADEIRRGVEDNLKEVQRQIERRLKEWGV